MPAVILLPDAFILFVLLALFHGFFSNAFTREYVRLGRVPADKPRNLSAWNVLGFIFGGGLVVSLIYGFILSIDKLDGPSIGIATFYKMGIIALSITLGSWIGIRWGGAGEHAGRKGE